MKQDYLQMRVLELAPQVYVSGQVFATDLDILAKQGVKSIINNRPDGEVPGQPRSEDLAKAAEVLGLAFIHFPIEPGPISTEAARSFAEACEGLDRPLLVFSRVGRRSTKLWEAAEEVV